MGGWQLLFDSFLSLLHVETCPEYNFLRQRKRLKHCHLVESCTITLLASESSQLPNIWTLSIFGFFLNKNGNTQTMLLCKEVYQMSMLFLGWVTQFSVPFISHGTRPPLPGLQKDSDRMTSGH